MSLLDGDKFEVITRFASRYALHGGPKFTPDGRYVFRLARWLDHQVRPVAPARGGRGACGPEHAQRGRERRRPLGDGGQLPAAQRRCSMPT